MEIASDRPELTYIAFGFLAALFLNDNLVDRIVGGCETGQEGFEIIRKGYRDSPHPSGDGRVQGTGGMI